MATKTGEQTEAPEAAAEGSSDGPLLDMSDAAVQKMIQTGKTRGFVPMTVYHGLRPRNFLPAFKNL